MSTGNWSTGPHGHTAANSMAMAVAVKTGVLQQMTTVIKVKFDFRDDDKLQHVVRPFPRPAGVHTAGPCWPRIQATAASHFTHMIRPKVYATFCHGMGAWDVVFFRPRYVSVWLST